ncbi:MAG: alpha-hydroxy-acid oxidizing protein [Vicinamibacterales bacterium]
MAATTRREWLQRTAPRAGRLDRQATTTARPRVTPRDGLVNVLEFEAEAATMLGPDLARLVAGGDRAPFDRITFRPRMMVNCLDLDLSVDLFGVRLFAPVIAGPIADPRRFHAEGEAAVLRGAGAAKAAVVLNAGADAGIDALAAAPPSVPVFVQVFAGDDLGATRTRVEAAERAGCKAVMITVGPRDAAARARRRIDWTAVDRVMRDVSVPAVVKGVASVDEARAALTHGAGGLVVSTYGQPEAPGQPAPLDLIAPIVEAVGDRVPVLADGGFRRGTDIMKALAFGATAVLVARPIAWGLAAYGADGVQAVLEMLQTELGRVMACCGTPTLAAIGPAVVKRHRTT